MTFVFVWVALVAAAGCHNPDVGAKETGYVSSGADSAYEHDGYPVVVDVWPDYLWKIPPMISRVDTLLDCGHVQIEIRGEPSAGEAKGQSRYHYVVINKPGGAGSITEFSLNNVAREPDRWTAPLPWRGSYVPEHGTGRFVFTLSEALAEFGIGPGDTLFEFTLESRDPPGALKYWATVCDEGLDGAGRGEVTGVISGPIPPELTKP